MSEKIMAGDRCAAQIAGPAVEEVGAPRFVGDFVCYAPGSTPDAPPVEVWRDSWKNIVVDHGRQIIINRVFASQTVSSAGAFVFLHGASIGSGNSWGDISGSRITNHQASYPPATFATTAANSASVSGTFGISAGAAQTVSGAGIFFFTSGSCGTDQNTGANASLARLYCYGTFVGGSQQLNSNNTVSATVTVSYASV